MFDPTIFDNMKVVLEGAVYDLDLTGEILVVGRSDMVDLATMARIYSIQFVRQIAVKDVVATLQLSTQLKDIAGELLKEEKSGLGAQLVIKFKMGLKDEQICLAMQERLSKLWQYRPTIEQTISYKYDQPEYKVHNLTIDFGRKIDESHLPDLSRVINLSLKSLKLLEEI